MAITNHKSEQQFIKYVKTSRDERVQEVQDYWDKMSKANWFSMYQCINNAGIASFIRNMTKAFIFR